MNSELYLDLDGVLCDFENGARTVVGKKHPNFDLTPEEEQQIAQVHDFWEKLDWQEGGRELWGYIKEYNPYILSAYASWDEVDSKRGKYIWIKENLGNIPNERIHLVRRSQKQNFAMRDGKSMILIDDFDKNIKEWRMAGGIGIHHVGVKSTIEKLKTLGYDKYNKGVINYESMG